MMTVLAAVVATSFLLVGTPCAGAVTIERPASTGLGASLSADRSNEPAPNYLDSDVKKAKHRCDLYRDYMRFGPLQSRDIEAAHGRKYRGGVSLVADYLGGKCHIIVRYGKTLHGPHHRGV